MWTTIRQADGVSGFTGAVCIAGTLAFLPDDSALTFHPKPTLTAQIGMSYSAPDNPFPSEEETKTFQRLAEQWRHETMDFSSLTDIVAHPAYLGIIAMGKVANHLILSELEKRPDHWFVALAAINQINPVSPSEAGNMRKMTEAWLKWGGRLPA